MDQEQVWNKISARWNKFRQKPVPEVEEFLKDKKGKILDLGCGSGRNMTANPDVSYYGVDFSEEMLKFAEKNARDKKIRAVFLKEEIGKEKLPLKNNFFDAVTCISTIHLIESAEKRKKALEEIYRVVKRGAEAMISVWNKNSDPKLKDIAGKEACINWKQQEINYPRYYYFYDKEELENLLKETGFKILDKNPLKSEHSRKNLVVFLKK